VIVHHLKSSLQSVCHIYYFIYSLVIEVQLNKLSFFPHCDLSTYFDTDFYSFFCRSSPDILVLPALLGG
jgi:hypothetical protein